jgi:two-component system sensor histidine kinase/response regulator
VLIVDDNPSAREILQEPLTTIASRVDAVASGKEAIAAVQSHDTSEPYDIVFMDWRMPGMDGLQASRHIKGDETLRHKPAIVLVTAFGREEVREEAERLQLDGFLMKPVTKSMIVDTLVNVFAAGGGSAGGTVQAADGSRLRGARILLAEDNEINQQIAVELLQGAGASVRVANNGREAVELLAASIPPPFDLVLMDLQMPEMDGYQATTKLRSDARLASLPIIAMTAHATIEERQRCLAAGMNDHVSKPIDPEALFETVGRFYTPSPDVNVPIAPGTDRDVTAPPKLPAIAGLDTADGVARVGGNQKLYVKLLRDFAAEQKTAVDQVRAALESGDVARAERAAHTLKGVAGNIGAKEVQAAAGTLEKLIRDRAASERIATATEHTLTVLAPLVGQITTAFRPDIPESVPVGIASVDPARSLAVGTHLRGLLADSDPGAGDFVEANRDALRPLFDEAQWLAFETSVQSYAFGDAQLQLDNALDMSAGRQ